MPDKKFYQVHGGYYPPNTAPKEHLTGYGKWKEANIAPESLKSPEYYLPYTKEIPSHQYIPARRPDHTSKDKIETMDTGYDKETMGRLLDAYKTAIDKYGVPQLTPKELTAMALVEGRSNFGFNDFDFNDPHAMKLQQSLMKEGHDPYAAGFPAAIMNKQKLADRIDKPLFQVWNGAGPDAIKYNNRVTGALETAEHPKNSNLYQFIQNKLGYEAPKVIPVRESDVEARSLPSMNDEQIARNSIEMPDSFRQGGRVKLI
jgi:hypothetical protein